MAQEIKSKNLKLRDFTNAINGGTLILLLLFFLTFILIILSPTESDGKLCTELSNIVKRENDELVYMFSTLCSETVLMAFGAMVTGIISFWYLSNKDKCTALLSTAVKRKTIYTNRFLPPLIGLLLAGFIPKFIAYGINVAHFGFSKELILCIVADALCLLVSGIFPYTCCAVGFTFTKTRFEAIAFSLAIVSAGSVMSYVAAAYVDVFVYGCGYGTATSSGFLGVLSNPILIPPIEVTDYMLKAKYYNSYIPAYIIYVTASVLTLALAKRFFTKKFKPEDIGKTGKCRTITIITVIAACFTAIAFICSLSYGYSYITTDTERIILLASSLAAIIVVSFVANAILTKKIKKIKNAVISIIICCAVTGTLTLWCLSGGTKYINTPPEAKKVESVVVSAPFYEFLPEGYDYYNFSDSQPSEHTIIEFSNPESIKKVIDIQDEISSTKKLEVAVITEISYFLKDGSVKRNRYEYISREGCDKMLTLWDTPEVKEEFRWILFSAKEESENTLADKGYKTSYWIDTESPITLTSKHQQKYDISKDLDDKAKHRLCEAIYEDIAAMTWKEYFTPQSTQVGYITFIYNGSPDDGSFNFCINESTPKTAKFLKDEGLWDKLTEKSEIVDMYYIDADEYHKYYVDSIGDYGIYADKRYIHSPIFSIDELISEPEYIGFTPYHVTDPKEQTRLLDKAYFWYYAVNEGKLLRVTFKNGSYADYYIPE